MADKWDELTGRIKMAVLAEEPEAAMSAAFDFIAEIGRTIELVGADSDRIATALEKIAEKP